MVRHTPVDCGGTVLECAPLSLARCPLRVGTVRGVGLACPALGNLGQVRVGEGARDFKGSSGDEEAVCNLHYS